MRLILPAGQVEFLNLKTQNHKPIDPNDCSSIIWIDPFTLVYRVKSKSTVSGRRGGRNGAASIQRQPPKMDIA